VEPIAVVFGTALVAAMASDSWQQAHKAVAALWRRICSPWHVRAIEGELEELRELVLTARRAGRADTEQALAGVWQDRCQDLLRDDPGAAAELGQVMSMMLAAAERAWTGQVIMTGSSCGSGTFNQVAGNQYNIRL
jgi:flagellar motor component MotA